MASKKNKKQQQGQRNQQSVAHGIKTGDELTLDIESLAGGSGRSAGSGVAKLDGLVVFVEGALPDSQVAAKVTAIKSDFVEAKIERIISPSPDTAVAPCPFFRPQGGGCGGCKLLGMTYEAQLREKQAQVELAFAALATAHGALIHPITAASEDDRVRHRNRVDFAASARQYIPPPMGGSAFGAQIQDAVKAARATGAKARGSGDASGRGIFLGLRPAGVSDAVIDVNECLLPSPAAAEVYSEIRNWLLTSEDGQRIRAWDNAAQEGFLRELTLRSGAVGLETEAKDAMAEEVMVHLITASSQPHLLQPLADFLWTKFGETGEVGEQSRGSKAVGGTRVVGVLNGVCAPKHRVPAPHNMEASHVLHGQDFQYMKLRGLGFKVSAASFFQTCTPQAEKLYHLIEDYVVAALSEDCKQRAVIYDLFCGTGSIGLCLAAHALEGGEGEPAMPWSGAQESKAGGEGGRVGRGHVYGFELVPEAVEDARRNALANGLSDSASFYVGDLARILSDYSMLEAPDVIVTDPPRAGMPLQCVKDMVRLGAPSIVYVSCNVATQVRDIRLLAELGGYQLVKAQAVDMFPHTPHMESVALLRKQ